MNKKTISIVVPVYNEEKGIKTFLEKRLFPAIQKNSKYEYEIVLVDDGSSDRTLNKIYSYSKNKNIKIIALVRNFGKEMALSAGLRYAKGNAVLTIDSDGQQPPEKIPEFIKAWEKGSEIVIGVRDHYTKHGFIPKIGSRLFYRLLRIMGNKSSIPGTTDFRLMDRSVVDEYNTLTEHNRITRGLVDWLGYEKTIIYYTYGKRIAGRPSYKFKKLFNLAIDSFISMSTTPLVIFGYLGLFITFFSFMLGIFCIINQYILSDPLHLYWNGAVQMAIFITFLVGLVLVSQAITALYISHIHAETQNRPLYIISQKKSRNIRKRPKKNPC